MVLNFAKVLTFYIFHKVIVTQASKTIQEVGRSWKATVNNVEGENMFRMESSIDSLAVMKSPSRSSKVSQQLLTSWDPLLPLKKHMTLKWWKMPQAFYLSFFFLI